MDYSFSVVIPVYNSEKYIGECIQSIIDQSYDNWHMYIIDDGSIDTSGTICDKYKNSKIDVIHTQNQGQVSARINGIEMATEDYTLVIDSDDVLDSNCLLRANEVINECGTDMVVFPYKICDENMVFSGELSILPEHFGMMSQDELLLWVIKTYNHSLVNKIVKTNLIKEGIKDSIRDKLKVNGDYALLIPIICQVKNAYFINEPFYNYRVHGKSTSHNSSFQHIVDTNRVSEYVAGLLERKGLFNQSLKDAVYCAHLHMICWMTEDVVYNGGVTKDNMKVFSELTLNKYLGEYISLECFSRKERYIYKTLIHKRSYINTYIKALNFLLKIRKRILSY